MAWIPEVFSRNTMVPTISTSRRRPVQLDPERLRRSIERYAGRPEREPVDDPQRFARAIARFANHLEA